jgi:periplasmic divalent cation tolerance protein
MYEITTTIDTKEKANKLAKRILEHNLAACAQISGPITSIYTWNNRLQEEDEFKVDFKTSRENVASAMHMIEEFHTYETPEIIAKHMAHVSHTYKQWMTEILATS